MRGGVVPPALLFVALACALSFAPRDRRWLAIIAAFVAACGASWLPLPTRWIEVIFLGVWASVVVAAAMVHLPRRPVNAVWLALALNCGLWAGASIAIAGNSLNLAEALPWLALVVPGAWLVTSNRAVAVKVVSSWLITIAILAAVLPIVTTPGYAPDHME